MACEIPRPERCIHDNGGKFIGHKFQAVLRAHEIKDVPTTSKNPQANAVCERMHQMVANILRAYLRASPPRNVTQATEMVDEALHLAMYAMRNTVHTTLGSSPGSLVFARDMFLNIPLVADWHQITKKREQMINQNLIRENNRRIPYDYGVGQKVYKKIHDPTKLGKRNEGPYEIERVHVNGTVTMRMRPGVTERINIRRIVPLNRDDAD